MKFLQSLLIISVVYAIALSNAFGVEEVAYFVNIEAKNNKVQRVPVAQLKQGQYQINSIYVKTKEKVAIDGNRFVSNTINQSFDGIKINALQSISNSTKVKNTPVERLYIVEYGIGIDSYDLAKELMQNPDIEYAVPVFNRYVTEYEPNDPLISQQWHINNIGSKAAWDVTKGSDDVVIGIVDSGTDWYHEDLRDNTYINEDEIPDNGIDDDENGFVDDVNGWDFVGNISLGQAINQQFRPDNEPAPLAGGNEHGTHVAGCASATTDNATGIAAIGFNTKMIHVKCGSDNWTQTGTRGIFKGYQGILYAAENGADIINCSWGGPGYNPAEQEIINSVTEMGILVVASAGNDGQTIDEDNFFPTGYDNILSVGSINSNNRKSGFSNFGVRTDVYAPGGNIYATLPGNRYGNNSGTSMAGPVAAGLAALIKAANPDWTPHQIAAQMRSTTKNLANVSEANRPLYFGRIDAEAALTSNTNNFSNNKVKGMAISENSISESGVIDSYDQVTVNLTLVNYLAPVDGVRLELIALDQYIDIENDEFIVNGLGTMDESDLELKITLTDMNPWYDGFARILVKYTAEDYSDYQLVKIPIVIESMNEYNEISRFQEEYWATFHDIHSPTPGVIWAVGQNRLNNQGYIYNTTANRIFPAYSSPLTSVFAWDNSNAWVTTGNGHILQTTNGGIDWTDNNFSQITGFFNGIYFFDENNGIAIGDAKNNQFGAVRTTNGGKNWSQASTLSAVGNEGGLVNSHCIFGDRIWFGTNAGRVLRGINFGKNWSQSVVDEDGSVLDVAFESNLKGMALYINRSKFGNDLLMATTRDGGLNWDTEVTNFTEELGVNPVDLIYNTSAEKIFAVCENGEVYYTENLGSSWSAVLTKKDDLFERATISNDVELFKMYGVGKTTIGMLDFIMTPENAIASVTSDKGDSFRFDSTEINKKKAELFKFENDGDLTIFIDNFFFRGEDGESFGFFGNLPKEIKRGSTEQLLVQFQPDEAREYNAELVMESNSDNGDLVITLSGKGYEKEITSVEFDRFDKSVTLYPTPATTNLNVDINYDDNIFEINLLSISGELLESRETNIQDKNIQFNLNGYSSGVYLIQFVTEKGTFYKKAIVE